MPLPPEQYEAHYNVYCTLGPKTIPKNSASSRVGMAEVLTFSYNPVQGQTGCASTQGPFWNGGSFMVDVDLWVLGPLPLY